MREVYREQLNLFVDELARMTRLVETAMTQATTALLEADLLSAEQVVAEDAVVSKLHRELDDGAVILVARQQPVAGDLRTIVAGLRMSADLERMGRLARHIAQMAVRRYPRCAVPAEVRETIVQMSRVAGELTARAAATIDARDGRAVADLERYDEEMDRLQRSLYRGMLDGPWPHGTESALDVTLIGRCYERYADHAVALARNVAFLAGQGPLDRRPRTTV